LRSKLQTSVDPYGFDVNWSSFTQPIAEVMQNPPLCSALGRGASFHTSFGGPPPWVVNEIPPKRFYVITFK
jgi:hypothetical protein